MSINIKRPAISYENIALVQSDTPCHNVTANSGDKLTFLPSVQGLNFSFDIPRQNEGSLGNRNFATNSNWRLPDVNLTISTNEDFGNLFSNFLSNLDNDVNFYAIVGEKRGFDVLSDSVSGSEVISFGNCFLTDLSISQSTVDFLKSDYSFLSSNVQAQKLIGRISSGGVTGASGKAPSLNLTGDQSQDVPVVFNNFPSDSPSSFSSGIFNQTGRSIPSTLTSVTLESNSFLGKLDSIQNFSLSLPIARKSIYGIGKQAAIMRKSIFPSEGRFSVDNLLSNFETTGKFSNLKNLDRDNNYNVNLNFTSIKGDNSILVISGARLDSTNTKIEIGGNLTSSYGFSFSTHKMKKLS